MSEINDRIAKAKGWTWEWCHFEIEEDHAVWVNPDGYAAMRPDYVGTLEGVAGLMRELQSQRRPVSQWTWYWNDRKRCFAMRHAAWRRRPFRRQVHAVFYSPKDRPSDCVGRAWLSVFGKEV